MATKARIALREFQDAARTMELAEAAINILERLSTSEASAAIRALKRGQQKQLRLLDAAAAKLGAPYPAPQQDQQP
jgi:hypothetical protein